jgi:Ser/Thr protein kinase RdoA (MazF antagonist)
MDKQLKDKFNDAILQEAMRRYDITADQIHPLHGFENFIYEFRRGRDAYVLRLNHTMRRSVPMICGEVDWINYLAAGGASVAKAVPSPAGNLVELIDDGQGGFFLATAFVKAPGKPPWEAGWTPERYETYGRLIGRMHALTKQYEPPDSAWKRGDSEEEIAEEIKDFLPASEALALQKYQVLMDHVRTLPKDRDSYGLIHYDAHEANIFIAEDGTITLFDFDDMGYNWFIGDIAMVVFYKVTDLEDRIPDRIAHTREFMPHFLHGYSQENQLDPAWLKEIPIFLKLREILLYAVIHRSLDVNNLDDSPWIAHFMNGRKHKIEQDIPYIDFDFESLAVYL